MSTGRIDTKGGWAGETEITMVSVETGMETSMMHVGARSDRMVTGKVAGAIAIGETEIRSEVDILRKSRSGWTTQRHQALRTISGLWACHAIKKTFRNGRML